MKLFIKRGALWLNFKDPAGARRRIPTGFPAGQERAAQAALPGLLARALSPVPDVPTGVPSAPVPLNSGHTFEGTFRKALRERESWITAKDRPGIEMTYEAVVDYWGRDTDLAKCTREAVLRWREAMKEAPGKRQGTTLAHSTINHRLSLLSVLLEVAGLAPHTVKHLSTKGARRKRRPREEELRAVVSWCIANSDRKGALDMADAVTTALHLVCRQGELLGLLWGDVYLDSRLVMFRDTKNGESRAVPMNEEVYRVLRARVGNGLAGPFAGLTSDRITALWAQARKALGLEHDHEFVFHVATRHEGASRLGELGASAFQIKAVMGNSIQAADIYVKPHAESLRALTEGIIRRT